MDLSSPMPSCPFPMAGKSPPPCHPPPSLPTSPPCHPPPSLPLSPSSPSCHSRPSLHPRPLVSRAKRVFVVWKVGISTLCRNTGGRSTHRIESCFAPRIRRGRLRRNVGASSHRKDLARRLPNSKCKPNEFNELEKPITRTKEIVSDHLTRNSAQLS